jgi:hypothetical protein
MMNHRALALAGILLGACGGDDDGGGGGSGSGSLSEPAAEALCEEDCVRAVDCGWETSQAECEAECQDVAEFARGDAMDYLVDCRAEIACTDSPELCVDRAEDDLPRTGAQQRFEQACEDRVADCVGEGQGAEFCDADLYWLLSDEVMADLEACLEEPCTEIGDCTRDVTDRF